MEKPKKEDVHRLRMIICDELGKENKDSKAMESLLEVSNEFLKELESLLE